MFGKMKKNLNVSIGKIGLKKGGQKKMMTGGMANSNAKASVQTAPGSKGVTPGMNPKASVAPAKMYGGKMKMGGMKKMGKKK